MRYVFLVASLNSQRIYYQGLYTKLIKSKVQSIKHQSRIKATFKQEECYKKNSPLNQPINLNKCKKLQCFTQFDPQSLIKINFALQTRPQHHLIDMKARKLSLIYFLFQHIVPILTKIWKLDKLQSNLSPHNRNKMRHPKIQL